MRKAFKAGGIALAVLFLAAGLLLFLDVNQFRGTIQTQLETSLGRKVSFGTLTLKLIPLAVRMEDVRIGDDPAFSGSTPFLTAKEIFAGVHLLPLLRKDIQITALRVKNPHVELIRNPAGQWNFSSLGRTRTSSPDGQSLSLDRLTLENGRLAVTGWGTRRERVVYENIDLSLHNLAPREPFTAELAVHLPDNVDARLKCSASYAQESLQIALLSVKIGSMDITGSGSAGARLVDLRLKMENGAIAELARLAGSLGAGFTSDMKVDGALNAQVHITGPPDAFQLTGDISATRVEVNRSGWKQPVRTASVKIHFTPEMVRTTPFVVESGNTRLGAVARITGYPKKPLLAASLSTKGASLEELLHIAAAYGAPVNGITGSGTISLDVRANGPLPDLTYGGSGLLDNATLQLPALSKPLAVKTASVRFEEDRVVLDNLACSLGGNALRGMINVRNFSAPEVEFTADVDQLNVEELQSLVKTGATTPTATKPSESPLRRMKGKGSLSVGRIQYGGMELTKVKSQCSLDGGVLKLDPVTAELFGGAQRGSMAIDLRPEAARYAVQTKLERVDANQLLSSTTSLKKMVYGLLVGEADLQFAPRPGEEIARSLNGTIAIKLNDGKLSGVSLINEMARIAKFFGYTEKGGVAPNILSLAGTMKIQDGVASTNDLRMAFDGGSLNAAGSIGLVDQSLKLKLTSVLAKGLSDQFGGGKAGGYLTTALANPKGELVIPCLVSGTMAKPVFTPDAAEFAKLKMQSILPSGGNAAGLVGGVLDAIGSGKKEGGKGVGGALLDMLSPRKK